MFLTFFGQPRWHDALPGEGAEVAAVEDGADETDTPEAAVHVPSPLHRVERLKRGELAALHQHPGVPEQGCAGCRLALDDLGRPEDHPRVMHVQVVEGAVVDVLRGQA